MFELGILARLIEGLGHGIEALILTLYTLFDRHTAPVLLLSVLVEEAGVPLPVPTDTLIALAGYQVGQGRLTVVEAVLAVQIGTLLGSTLLYALGRRLGIAGLLRLGRVVRLQEAQVARVELWVRRNALAAVFVGRLVPGLRIATSAAAGVFGVPLRTFLLATSLSTLLWCWVWLAVGWLLGDLVLTWLEGVRHAALWLLAALLAGGAVLWSVRRRRDHLALVDEP